MEITFEVFFVPPQQVGHFISDFFTRSLWEAYENDPNFFGNAWGCADSRGSRSCT